VVGSRTRSWRRSSSRTHRAVLTISGSEAGGVGGQVPRRACGSRALEFGKRAAGPRFPVERHRV
jgi:hypothetical protein